MASGMISRLFHKVFHKITAYGELVMFSHTLFSLPFALIAMLLAANGLPKWSVVFWILLALVAGRNGANALNRYVDADVDARNPRTASRQIPTGKIRRSEALALTIFCYIVFVFAAFELNWVCFILSPVALLLFTLYSYTKRFTWLCHLILGITCAGAPVGAWLAVTAAIAWPPLVLGAIVALWVAGFDILYGTQDIEFDKKEGLFSIPARFGYRGALLIARIFHFIMWSLLVLLVFITPLSAMFLSAVLISGLLLILEHYLVDPAHREKMNFASYHINQIISVLLLVFAIMDIFWIK